MRGADRFFVALYLRKWEDTIAVPAGPLSVLRHEAGIVSDSLGFLEVFATLEDLRKKLGNDALYAEVKWNEP